MRAGAYWVTRPKENMKYEILGDRSAAEGVVVGVGVDAVEDGVGVVALVQQVLGGMQAARQQAVKVLNLVAVRVDNESAKVKDVLADARKATDEAIRRLYDVLNALAFCILFLPVSRIECRSCHVIEACFRGGVSLLFSRIWNSAAWSISICHALTPTE